MIAKSPVVNGFITQGINGVETEADSNPTLLARIWAKVREWADKIHTHDNKKTLDQLFCKALEDMFSQGDDDGYLRFRGDKLRPISDGVVIKEVEEIEKDGAKFLRLLLNKGGGLSNNWLPDFIDIPVTAVKEVEEEGFDFTLNGSELELPTGGAGGGGLTPEQAEDLEAVKTLSAKNAESIQFFADVENGHYEEMIENVSGLQKQIDTSYSDLNARIDEVSNDTTIMVDGETLILGSTSTLVEEIEAEIDEIEALIDKSGVLDDES